MGYLNMSEQASQYPEHEKLEKVQSQSRAIGNFLEWLQDEEGVYLATSHEHTEDCREEGEKICGCYDGQLLPVRKTVEQWLAQYFQIDLAAVECEKRKMLDCVRSLHLNDEEE